MIDRILDEITSERNRLKKYGYKVGSALKDDYKLKRGDIERAAACYVISAIVGAVPLPIVSSISVFWPWKKSWFDPKSSRKSLVTACALIIEAIERHDKKVERMVNRT